jgi:hypothetical protein
MHANTRINSTFVITLPNTSTTSLRPLQRLRNMYPHIDALGQTFRCTWQKQMHLARLFDPRFLQVGGSHTAQSVIVTDDQMRFYGASNWFGLEYHVGLIPAVLSIAGEGSIGVGCVTIWIGYLLVRMVGIVYSLRIESEHVVTAHVLNRRQH